MSEYSKNAWKYYEYGRTFNSSLQPSQYKTVEINTEFFNGNQWNNLPDNKASRKLAKPVFNIIKRITGTFVASLTSSGTTVRFEAMGTDPSVPVSAPGHLPFQGRQQSPASGGVAEAAEFATTEVRNLLEKFKMDYRIRDALFDGAITGDYCAHFYWNPEARPYGGVFGEYRGEIEMELVDGINVMFGNPNITDVEKQPYIIIVGRDTVENLKREKDFWEARTGRTGRTGKTGDGLSTAPEAGDVLPDAEPAAFQYPELRGDDDKSGKATYVYMYTRINGTVRVTKATRTCTVYENIDTGLTRFPVAWGVWQKQKNCYHGRAMVTEVIPNQIFINQMMAMVFRHLQTQAFPTKVFNADLLPGLSNEVGTAIGVRNLLPGQSLGTVVSTIPASDMSSQILSAIELCMRYTRECLGATDAQLGDAQATNTSALMVLQNASEVPLENARANLHEWVEDIGGILLDMMGTYYGVRPVGDRIYDFSVFRQLWFNISVDVGATNYWSEIATVQTLDNLRKEGALSLTDYLERIPDRLITRKQELIEKLKREAAATQFEKAIQT